MAQLAQRVIGVQNMMELLVYACNSGLQRMATVLSKLVDYLDCQDRAFRWCDKTKLTRFTQGTDIWKADIGKALNMKSTTATDVVRQLDVCRTQNGDYHFDAYKLLSQAGSGAYHRFYNYQVLLAYEAAVSEHAIILAQPGTGKTDMYQLLLRIVMQNSSL